MVINNQKLQIGVIGTAGKISKALAKKAKEIGFLLGKMNIFVVTGGKDGVMKAVASGVKQGNGINIGVIKGKKRFSSNKFIDIEILTGMTSDGFDELLLVLMSDVLIVVGGGAGTLEEIAIAYRNRKPIIILEKTGGWADKILQNTCYLDQKRLIKIEKAKTPKEAVEKAIFFANKKFQKTPLINHLQPFGKG